MSDRVASDVSRFWGHVKVVPGKCWLWQGYTPPSGYAQIRIGGRRGQNVYVHRFSYELHIGPIPVGMTVDHVKSRGCRFRSCVNPAHLELVSMRENNLRGDSPAALNALKTECPRGHGYTPSNTMVISGKRRCRACNKAAMAALRARGYNFHKRASA